MLTFRLCDALEHADLPRGARLDALQDKPSVSGPWLDWFPADGGMAASGGEVRLGLLTSRRLDRAEFPEAEIHTGPELFLTVSGKATMLLRLNEGWRLVCLPERTVLLVDAGVPHYLGPSVTERAVCAVAGMAQAETRMLPLTPGL